MVLCDSFNISPVFWADAPGFSVGLEGELRSMPGKVINRMNARTLVTVPTITVIKLLKTISYILPIECVSDWNADIQNFYSSLGASKSGLRA